MPKIFAGRHAVTLLAALILGVASTPGHANITCGGGYCQCWTDDDCNYMFITYCKPEGGQCQGSGDTASCVCPSNKNAPGISKGNPNRHPILTPPRYPIHGGPGHGKPIRGKPIYGKPISGKPVQAPPSGGGNTILERGEGHGGRH